MAVKRIVTNIATDRIASARAFYCDVLDMKIAMDLGWITTFTADASAAPQVSIATEGGAGTAVPDISIEVDNFDEVHRRTIAGGFAIEHGPVTESWGVKRFYVRDPYGRLVNVLTHSP